jgi:T5SS/PEP-CTERM-associated repeat protein
MGRKWRSKMKKLITLFAIAGMVLALAPAALAAIVLDGSTKTSPYVTSGALAADGVSTMDDGSLWTHNDDLLKFGNRTTASITISGGAVLNVTAASVGDTYALQFGNQSGGVVQAVVTGAGSKAKTLTAIQIGRNDSGTTLTIDLGGLVMAEGVMLARSDGSNNFIRMGLGGILAIEGTGKTTTAQFWSTGGDASNVMQYDTGSGWANITGATSGVDYNIADGSGDLAGYSVLTMIPEPATMSLLAIGGLALLRRRKRA